MGMSTRIIGLRNMDGQFEKMLKMKLLCEKQKFSHPKEVSEYFGHLIDEEEIDIRAEMQIINLYNHPAVKEFNADMQEGFEVDLSKIDMKEIKTIRFINSY